MGCTQRQFGCSGDLFAQSRRSALARRATTVVVARAAARPAVPARPRVVPEGRAVLAEPVARAQPAAPVEPVARVEPMAVDARRIPERMNATSAKLRIAARSRRHATRTPRARLPMTRSILAKSQATPELELVGRRSQPPDPSRRLGTTAEWPTARPSAKFPDKLALGASPGCWRSFFKKGQGWHPFVFEKLLSISSIFFVTKGHRSAPR